MQFSSDRLKELRKKKGLTQKQVAEKLGMSVNGYQNYELATTTPNNLSIKALANFFNVNPNYLTGESDDPRVEIPESSEDDFIQKVTELIENNPDLNEPEFLNYLYEKIEEEFDYLKWKFAQTKEKNR
jgi:transcriptional regulator with XRE-family HTH domain